jgi:hypothetical protein
MGENVREFGEKGGGIGRRVDVLMQTMVVFGASMRGVGGESV